MTKPILPRPEAVTPITTRKGDEGHASTARWLMRALCELDKADSIVTISSHALTDQGVDIDRDVCLALDEMAWPAIHKAQRALLFALRTIDPDKVPERWNLAIDTVYDAEEAQMLKEVSHGR